MRRRLPRKGEPRVSVGLVGHDLGQVLDVTEVFEGFIWAAPLGGGRDGNDDGARLAVLSNRLVVARVRGLGHVGLSSTNEAYLETPVLGAETRLTPGCHAARMLDSKRVLV